MWEKKLPVSSTYEEAEDYEDTRFRGYVLLVEKINQKLKNPASHCGEMCDDREMDWTHSYIPQSCGE